MFATRMIRQIVTLSLIAIAALRMGGCTAAPQAYATPDAAVDSLVAALRTDDSAKLGEILGADSKALLSSGDKVADANGRAEFLRQFDEKHSLTPADDGSMTLVVGATDWPVPIPLVKNDDGWIFDTKAGLDEMLSRRIGRNELDAIQVCLAIVDAQRDFAAADYDGDGWREYARQFRSDPGKKNGLYWPAGPGEPDSPLGQLVADATAEGYGRDKAPAAGPRPFHGYYYRILTAQGPAAEGGAVSYIVQNHMIGGFAVVAWPAEYANSGLKTFIVSYHGIVYEKDLGDDTDKIARSMTEFNPSEGWQKTASATN